MVKNLPTVERSTKIRFGKNVPDSDVQAENTIVINASNTLVTTPNSGSIYMSPVRFRDDFTDNNIVLMMYNRETGELSESGESASNLVGGQTLQATTERGNTTTLTTRFTSLTTGIVTAGKVGVSNLLPGHTLSVGSNVYIDDTGSNVLVVSGGVLLDGNLTVNGGVTSIVTENLKIKDPIIELGQNNTSEGTTLDLGLIMTRPQSNVTVGFLESSKEIVMGFTESSADSNVITPLTDEDINVHVYGRLYTEANVGILNTDPLHTLDIGSNLYVDEFGSNILVVTGNTSVSGDLTVDSGTMYVDSVDSKVGIKTLNPDAELHIVGNAYVSSNLTVDTDTLHVDAVNKRVGIETVNPDANLHVVGNVYVSSDLTVDTDTLHVDASGSKVGIKTKSPDAELHVVGNAYVSSNLTVDTDTLHVDSVNKRVGIETKNPQANLHVVGNVYVSSNLTVDTDTFHVDSVNKRVGIETKNPNANLHVVGNVYVSSNLTVDTDTFHVDSVNKRVGIETKNPTSNLHVVGNVYVSSNLTTDGTLTLNHPTTALITDLTANVEVNLNQLANVVLGEKALANEDMLVYDGSNWRNQLQNHTFLYAKAEETINKGEAVYATGTVGNNTFSIRKAQANSSATMPALGLAYQDFALNDQGLIVTFGRADGINTDNFESGETVYVSNVTAGALSNVKPYAASDFIQNIGLVVKGHPSTGIVSVTGVGRSNDIPNAPIVADEGDINYVYVNDANNDFKKILPTNLLTQLQTLQQVTDTGNTSSNVVQFTNATTGLVTTSNLQIGSNISIGGLTLNKLPIIGTNNFLEDSSISRDNGTIIISSDLEVTGNIVVNGNSYNIESNSLIINDRVLGIANNNTSHNLDIGIIMQHPGKNVALIHHGEDGAEHEHEFTIGFTQNTVTDDHISDDAANLITVNILGNLITQNTLTVSENIDVTGTSLLSGDLTVGGASNLFVDVSTSNVGINEGTPLRNLDVNGDVRVQDTIDAVSTTTGALIVSGGLGVAKSIHAVTVRGTTLTGTNLYGTVAGSNTVAASDLTASGTVKGATLTGTNLYGTLAGANTVAASDLTASGTVKGATLTGTNLYGTLAGANTVAASDLTASGTVKGATLTGTNLYGTLAGSNAVAASDLTASGTVKGATLTGTNLYGTLAGSNAAAMTTLNASGVVTLTDTTSSTSVTTGALKVAGGISTQENLSVGGDVFITDTAAGSEAGPEFNLFRNRVGVDGHYLGQIKFKGKNDNNNEKNYAKITGKINDASNGTEDGLLEFATIKGGSQSIRARLTSTNFKLLNDAGIEVDGTADITNTTESTSTTTGALKVAGGVGIAKDVYVGERAYVTGGLITNTGQVTKKTYSFTGALDSGQTIADSTIKITFSAHVFYAKIVAHLIESDNEVSTLSMECGGGHRTGGTPLTIAKGPVSVFGSASTNPWNVAVAATTTTVSLAPTTNMAAAGNYNIFIEYISAHASGAVTKITEGSTDVITFGY